jgi:hypothetical protein
VTLSEKLAVPSGKRYRCGFAHWKASLPEDEQATVERVLDDPSYTIEEIVRAFAEEGCPVRHHRIRIHRARECLSCNS